jgi:uncharacterized protein YkwD
VSTFVVFLVLHFLINTANLGLWGENAWVEEALTPPTPPPGEDGKVFELINQERIDEGLRPLIYSSQISAFAWKYANRMKDEDFYGHEDPQGRGLAERLKDADISYSVAGEIIAENSSADGAVQAWMNSPGHKEQILTSDYTTMGIGIVEIHPLDKFYVVLLYRPPEPPTKHDIKYQSQ